MAQVGAVGHPRWVPKIMSITCLALAALIGCGTEPTETTSAAADIEDALPFAPTTVAERAPSPELSTTTTAAPTAMTAAPTTTTVAPLPPPKTATPQPVAAAGDCHPSYDPCLVPATDYDCEGGEGDGPAYAGRVNVIGPDDYELDRDGDGVGCD